MYRLKKSKGEGPLLQIQSLACCPHSTTSTRSKSPPLPRSPLRQSPTRDSKTSIRASLPDIRLHQEQVSTADANIATISTCPFVMPKPLLSVCNIAEEVGLVVSPTVTSPEGRNCFLTSNQRSKSSQKISFRRVRKDKFSSLDVKSPRTAFRHPSESLLNPRIYLPKMLKRVKVRQVAWLCEPLSGQMAGYSLLKRQRVRRKEVYRSARTPFEEDVGLYGDLERV